MCLVAIVDPEGWQLRTKYIVVISVLNKLLQMTLYMCIHIAEQLLDKECVKPFFLC